MDEDRIMTNLRSLGKRRHKIMQEVEALRKEIHLAAIEASTAGLNNQQIAQEIGVTREIIRRHVGPAKEGRGEQESS